MAKAGDVDASAAEAVKSGSAETAAQRSCTEPANPAAEATDCTTAETGTTKPATTEPAAAEPASMLYSVVIKPVALPPGRARLSIKPGPSPNWPRKQERRDPFLRSVLLFT